MKKFCFFAALVLLLLVILKIIGTFALFETETSRAVESGVGEWTILINGTDITNNTVTFNINSFNWNTTTEVKENKFAPGMNGYFDIIINPSSTDVSVKYNITYDLTELNDTNITISSIIEKDGRGLTRTGESTYTGVITLSQINSNITNTIRTNLSWVNNEANNDTDSELGLELDNDINIPIRVDVFQY